MREKQLNKRPRTGGAFTFIAVFSAMCLSIVAALLFANDGRRFGELLDVLGMDRQSRQNEQAASRDPALKALTPARPPLLERTTRTQRPHPDFDEADCRSLALLSQTSVPEFRSYVNGGWECSYLLEFPETGLSSSVFIQVRGDVYGAWSNFRIKLNFGSHLSRQNLASVTVGLVDRLAGLGVSNKDALQQALARQRGSPPPWRGWQCDIGKSPSMNGVFT
ncbi:hypothetical protein ABID21_004220 [Pseudorhizobium tarimense]|uniref:Uncharacterized protein n=1 Tax=Pseudorhizobium tarimense TaxID=1079109 RepID=A0ABV2HC20_9HYPH|nr:DUF6030 family protein [Pseudorhizobium tarimense]MCJ8521140.1 DUF6030 family protein [Pseudorhizobium tarimense]